MIDPANFVATIDNPYLPLTPGRTFIYEGQTSEGFNHTEFAVRKPVDHRKLLREAVS